MRLKRWFWLTFGVLSQICFGVLVISLMWFMQLGSSTIATSPIFTLDSVVINLALIVQFALPHSILLAPKVRQIICRYVPSSMYGCLFCVATCGSLWLMMVYWQPLPGIYWHLLDSAWWFMISAAAAAWILLAYSMWITGMGYQTGFTGLRLYWQPGSIAPRQFAPRGLYKHFRHPIYLSFLLITWLTPVMTTDRLLLSIGLTSYLFIGSWLKDRRLAQLIGEPYRAYMNTVPGYPGFHIIRWGTSDSLTNAHHF